MTSQIKFIKKPTMQSFENWEEELNLESRKGWRVIQIFQGTDGYWRALLRKDE